MAVGQAEDASRRTRLANERTYLAWWRTSLGAFAVALGAGKVVPSLTHEKEWPYLLLGVGFTLLGLAFLIYAMQRHQAVERALESGTYAPPNQRMFAALAASGMVLGVTMMIVMVIGAKAAQR